MAGTASAREARGPALCSIGLLASGREDAAVVNPFVERSVAALRELGDRHGLAYALCFLGCLVAELGGRHQDAWRNVEHGLKLFRALGSLTGTAYAALTLARLAYERGDLAEARPYLEEHVSILRQIGSPANVARALCSLGDIARALGDAQAARACYEESLTTARRSRDDGPAWWLEGRAMQCAESNPERAAQILGGAAALRRRLGQSLPQVEARERDRCEAAVRLALGSEQFEKWYAIGASRPCHELYGMSLEDDPG
jgi:tetratricopeptide (TPR) repeat protein